MKIDSKSFAAGMSVIPLLFKLLKFHGSLARTDFKNEEDSEESGQLYGELEALCKLINGDA